MRSSNFDDLDHGETLRGFREGQTVFGRYRLEKILGRGGMGVVWLGWDGKLERNMALKFLPEMVARDKMAVDDLKRETKRCLDITHPNIVRVYDFLEDEAKGLAGISMEYVDGNNLSNLRASREDRCFEVRELNDWAKALCEAMEYAHREVKVVHRDLKPANLMVTAGKLKVADFGIARSLVDSMSRVSANVGSSSGTLVYMSPQQAMGDTASALDDLYALGATLYDLLTGRPPFYTGNIYEQLKERAPTSVSVRRAELQSGKEPVPQEWEKTIAACLEKDPAKRPQSAGEVAYRLGLAKDYERSGMAEEPKRKTVRVNDLPTRPLEEKSSSLSTKSNAPMGLLLSMLALIVIGMGWRYGIEQPRQEEEKKRVTAIVEAQQQAAEANHQKELAEAKAKTDEAVQQRLAAEANAREAERQKQAAEAQRQIELADAKARTDAAERQRQAADAKAKADAAERQRQAADAKAKADVAERQRLTAEAQLKAEQERQQKAEAAKPALIDGTWSGSLPFQDSGGGRGYHAFTLRISNGGRLIDVTYADGTSHQWAGTRDGNHIQFNDRNSINNYVSEWNLSVNARGNGLKVSRFGKVIAGPLRGGTYMAQGILNREN